MRELLIHTAQEAPRPAGSNQGGVVDTDSLTPVDLNPMQVPPGSWLREATHCPRPLSPMFASGLPVVTETFRQAFAELGTWFDTVEYRVIGGWVYTRVVPLGGVEGQTP